VCKAFVLACADVVPFVVQALRTLADRCARLHAPYQWARALPDDRVY